MSLAHRLAATRDLFFRAHRTNDLTKKLEKVGPFECDELEKHCRVIYFKGLNAIEKSCFETLHTTSCVTRTALDRLCPEVGRSSTLRRNLLLFGFSILARSRFPSFRSFS